MSQFALSVILNIVGSGGMCGILFAILRKAIDNRMIAAEKQANDRRNNQIQRCKVDDELQHAYGRVLFWLVRFAQSGESNGELRSAFDELQEAETHKKNLDRDIIAQSEQLK